MKYYWKNSPYESKPRTCPYCKKRLPRNSHWKRKFCNEYHQKWYHEDQVKKRYKKVVFKPRICENEKCGKTFIPHVASQKNCCASCSYESKKKHQREYMWKWVSEHKEEWKAYKNEWQSKNRKSRKKVALDPEVYGGRCTLTYL